MFVTTTFICCKKGGKDLSDTKNNLINKWEIRTSVGGIAGTINFQPGNGNRLEFKSDNSFTQYENGSAFQSGTFDLKPTSETDQYKLIFHTNVREIVHTIILKSDTLVLLKLEPCCDFPDNTYVRLH